MGEAKRRKLLDASFGKNKKIELRDERGFVSKEVVSFARQKLLESGRGIVVLARKLDYIPLAQFTSQPEAYKLVSTYDTTVSILSVTPPKTEVRIELIREEIERLAKDSSN